MSNRNIYAAARNAAGLTQERAAECLAISVRSLADYESGVRLPSEEVAVQMVDVYHAQYLAYQHLRARSDLGRRLIPEVAADKLPQAVLELIDKIYDFADEHYDRRLIAIAKDGIIDETERPEFDRIAAQLQEIIKCALAVAYHEGAQ